MKKLFCILICVWMIFALAGCGEKEETEVPSSEIMTEDSEDESGTTESAAGEEDESGTAAEEQTEEADSEDFDIVTYSDGTCMLKDCDSEASVIEVPETIEEGGETYTVTSIGNMAFFQSSAEKIVLPDSVVTVDTMAFAQSINLKEIVFGSGLKTVAVRAFDDCTALETVTFPEGMETLNYNFFGCESLGEVYIPESVTDFPDGVIAVPDQAPNIVIVTPAGSAAETQALADGLTVRNP